MKHDENKHHIPEIEIPDPLDEELNELAQELLDTDFDDLSARSQKVIEHIADSESIAENPNTVYNQNLTFGQRLADSVAKIGGSWSFVIACLVILSIWILANSTFIALRPVDPYPFILLNLALSILTALQAPIIMMSQNRQAEKDRIEANANYEVCLKMELEITRLHQRLEDFENNIQIAKDSTSSSAP